MNLINENKVRLSRNLSIYDSLKAGIVCALVFLLVFGCRNKGNKGDNKNKRDILAKYTLTVIKPQNGTITSDPGDINCETGGDNCTAQLSQGTKITLTAQGDKGSKTTDLGYERGNWGNVCAFAFAEANCRLIVHADITVSMVFVDADVDDDNDGLIEVHNLDMFDHIRHNLTGTSYKTGADAKGNTRGASTDDATANCKTATDGAYLCGYELMRDLDFADGESYVGNIVKSNWQPNSADPDSATNGGFNGIADFDATFEGNGHSISKLYSKGNGNRGLFASTTNTAAIRNLGVVDAHLYGDDGKNNVGALVGYNQGSIRTSYAAGGNTDGGSGIDRVGGLVGYSNEGSILASYTKINANGGDGNDTVGGLVGYNFKSNIVASYTTGSANGGDGNDKVGGLVGYNQGRRSIIVSCYSISAASTNSIAKGREFVGALVGRNTSADIIVSYGFGNATGKPINSHGAPGLLTANGLTLTNAGPEWNDTNSNTLGAWDFGTDSQPPALKYADYDGDGEAFSCDQFPACGSLLPGQR